MFRRGFCSEDGRWLSKGGGDLGATLHGGEGDRQSAHECDTQVEDSGEKIHMLRRISAEKQVQQLNIEERVQLVDLSAFQVIRMLTHDVSKTGLLHSPY